jgi:phosphatidylethanolamine-binding protein (PEBP) family uncharacterized protein
MNVYLTNIVMAELGKGKMSAFRLIGLIHMLEHAFALIMHHPHVSATKLNRIYWAVINISADCNEIAENASGRNMPKESIELSNFMRTTPPYYGHEPQPGGMVYDYIIELYALNTILDDISDYKSYLEISNILEDKIIAKTQMLGT